MPLDAHTQRFLRALAAGNRCDVLTTSVAERRRGLAQLMQLGFQDSPIASTRELRIPGPAGAQAARLYEPLEADAAPAPGILYLHGGGLVAGGLDTHDGVARALCHYSRCRLLALDYRLAPEHPFPAALEDARAALEHLARHGADLGMDPARLALCGDSAGATLAVVTAQSLAGRLDPPLALQVLLCPILDYSRRSASRRELASGYLIDEATLEHDLRHYAPAVPAEDPRISPLRAERLEGVPPTLVHTAEFDPLRDEGLDYFKRLRVSGAALSYTCHAGMIHLFYGLGAIIPRARVALEQVGHEIRTALD
ncbi:MAG TPA: alpha/beta hydrolase [Steroidobacteraceae bacterium]|nr:alpha/beta hydrolase [Steroidobacteraceae bacterium]